MLPRLRPGLLVLALVWSAFAADSADNLATKILTPDLAQQLLGGTIEPAKRNSSADTKAGETLISQCSYSIKSDAVTPVTVSLFLRRAGTAEQAKTIFLASRKTYNGRDVDALGDASYRTAAPAQLNVLKGRNWLIISAGAFPKADPALQEKAAQAIPKNLPD